MKNRYFAALAIAGLVSFTACAEEEAAVEEPVVEEPVVAPVEPVVTDPAAPVMTDTAAVGAAGAAGATEIPGNGIDDDNDGQIDEAV